MIRLNNKGYMLVEIILASAIAFGVAYFLLELTIKLKNKNDDMLVKTLVSTDQAIITNIIMEDLYSGGADSFDCDNIKINFSNNTFTYNGKTNIVNEYVKFTSKTCDISDEEIFISIPLKVKNLDDDFNIKIKYKK